MRVRVIGAGVIGLSVALRLLQRGHDVTITATSTGTDTTSSVAAALWYPYLAAPAEKTRRWGAVTYDVLTTLAASRPESGVDVRWGREHRRVPSEVPAWHADVAGFATLDDGSWRFAAPVADMATYLPWLAGEVRSAGGRITRGEPISARALRAARRDEQDVVVLATGLGSREVAGDASVEPVRGQVVLVAQVGLDEWVLDSTGDASAPTYVVPRRDVIVCGGTALSERWDTDVDPATTADILARCRTLVPALRRADVRDVRVGLRPTRPSVRLERADELGSGDVAVVACYGHGGAGVTLSWGCAQDVVELIDGEPGT
jgi:D-amino-acid oxidase